MVLKSSLCQNDLEDPNYDIFDSVDLDRAEEFALLTILNNNCSTNFLLTLLVTVCCAGGAGGSLARTLSLSVVSTVTGSGIA